MSGTQCGTAAWLRRSSVPSRSEKPAGSCTANSEQCQRRKRHEAMVPLVAVIRQAFGCIHEGISSLFHKFTHCMYRVAAQFSGWLEACEGGEV